jgi:hypothetical protein
MLISSFCMQLYTNRLSLLPKAIGHLTALRELVVRTSAFALQLSHRNLPLAWFQLSSSSSLRNRSPSSAAFVEGEFLTRKCAFLFDSGFVVAAAGEQQCSRVRSVRVGEPSSTRASASKTFSILRCSFRLLTTRQLYSNQLCWLPYELDRLPVTTKIWVRASRAKDCVVDLFSVVQESFANEFQQLHKCAPSSPRALRRNEAHRYDSRARRHRLLCTARSRTSRAVDTRDSRCALSTKRDPHVGQVGVDHDGEALSPTMRTFWRRPKRTTEVNL